MTKTNAMTVDVEDYFQVSAFENVVDRADWDNIACRIPQNIEKILPLFERHNTRATFFTLGWVAERFPGLIRDIVAAGHEIASHGWSHVRVPNTNPDDFFSDIDRTRKLLQDVSGQAVNGYRAASYSVTKQTLWVYEKLAQAGYQYSSSIFPIRHDLYGIPDAPRKPFVIAESGITEIPLTTVNLAGKNFPCSGGGWFRLMPYALFKAGLKRVNEKDNLSGIFYFHPWEVDPDQPRQENIPVKTAFRHYLNLTRMEKRLDSLLEDFDWDTMQQVFLEKPGYPEIALSQLANPQ
jgi:polysaccharide deacetylase family protein (PEP-CTERM system associated)